MCTVSLFKQHDRLVITMNRDEYRDRHEAAVNSTHIGNTSICHPTDAQSGGSWAGINSHGMVLCLLNKYQVPTINDATSRGAIIPAALASEGLENTLKHMRKLNTEAYNGFDCLVVNQYHSVHFSWDRERYIEQPLSFDSSLMFTSSSERLDEVSAYRRQLFEQWQQQEPKLDSSSFHLQQADQQAANAVFMSRKPTHTKSLMRFYLSPSDASLEYYDQSALMANATLAELNASYRWHSKIKATV